MKTVEDLYKSPILDKPKVPYLKKIHGDVFTLVAGLENTLSSINKDIRPGVREFIGELSDSYEIVVFTLESKEYAEQVLKLIDPKDKIAYKLYKEHAIETKGKYIKDVSKLGRDMKRVIIMDSAVESFQLQPMNGIYVTPWSGSCNDTELLGLLPLLKVIVSERVEDVRMALRNYRDSKLRNIMSTYYH